jgi:glutamate/tyrosine decarboxylase-like PLP-dependent enzyme
MASPWPGRSEEALKRAEENQQVLDIAAEAALKFRQNIGTLPQRPIKTYAEMKTIFGGPVPENLEAGEAVIQELANKAVDGLQMATGPRFFGWVIGGSHIVGMAADWLTSAWGQNCGNHHAAPSAAAAETAAAGWLLELLDLPRESSVGFVTGATVANFVCLAAARDEVLRKAGWNADTDGLFGAPPITVLIGDDAHTTVFSALQFLGLGHDRVVRIPTDAQGRMFIPAFAEAITKVKGPSIVIAQAGQINTGAFDNFAEIVPLAKKAGAWLHVDGAFGLWARASSKTRHLAIGIEGADSWATDGHKWLQTPYDSGYAIVRNEWAHRRAVTIAASYLPLAAEGERDPSHYVPELSRRARGFATWAMIRHLGRSGIAAMVERQCEVARAMSGMLAAEPGIEILNDVVLNQIIVRFGSVETKERGDQLTRDTITRIQADGECFAGGAVWRGRHIMRLSVISWETNVAEGKRSAEVIIRSWRIVKQQPEKQTR